MDDLQLSQAERSLSSACRREISHLAFRPKDDLVHRRRAAASVQSLLQESLHLHPTVNVLGPNRQPVNYRDLMLAKNSKLEFKFIMS